MERLHTTARWLAAGMILGCLRLQSVQGQTSNLGLLPTSGPADSVDILTPKERAWLDAHPVIRVVMDPNWPPVEFADETGEPSGIVVDYLDLVEQRLGVTFERVRHLPWQEAYARLKRWDIDMTTSVTETPMRREFWAFTRPYMTVPIVIVTRQNVTYVADMHDLDGRKVAVVDGYIAGEWIPRDYPQIELVRVQTVKQALDLLESEEVFAVIDNMLVIGYYMAKLQLPHLKVAGKTPYINAQSMAVRKDWAPLAGILQKALNSISEPERAAIYQKWVPIRYEHGFDYRRFWQILGVFAFILGVLGVWIRKLSREIRFRKAAEAALRQSEEKHRLIFDSASDAIFILDEQGRMLACNQLANQRYGYSHEELMQMSIHQLLAPSEGRFVAQRLSRLMESENLTFESRYRHKDGSDIPTEVSGRRITWDGKPAIMSICRDITERKQAEDERAKLQSQLYQSQKMESVGRLAGGVAHDFNNMLAVILGHAEIAISRVAPADSLHTSLEQILEAAQRSADLTRQLLAFARKQTAAPKVLVLNDTLSGMLKMLQRLIGEDITLIWKAGTDLWPIRMDPTQVDQVLVNLSVNARDAMPQGGKLTIETQNAVVDNRACAERPGFVAGEYVQLTVADTGVGMDENVLEHVFEPFFTTKEAGKGTGLGAATIYGIVTQNHGFIDVRSEVGRGTTFTVYIPRYVGDVAEAAVPKASGPASIGHETVLLVDDEPAIIGLGRATLERAGYRVLAANSPSEAIRISDRHMGEIHIVVTDVVMPEMNGVDLVSRLLARRQGLKTLFMSAYTADTIVDHGVLDESVHFIQKPFPINGLPIKVREVLDGK